MKNKIYLRIAGSFKKSEIISTGNYHFEIIKLIESTWFKRLLTRLGFNMYIGWYKCKKYGK